MFEKSVDTIIPAGRTIQENIGSVHELALARVHTVTNKADIQTGLRIERRICEEDSMPWQDVVLLLD